MNAQEVIIWAQQTENDYLADPVDRDLAKLILDFESKINA